MQNISLESIANIRNELFSRENTESIHERLDYIVLAALKNQDGLFNSDDFWLVLKLKKLVVLMDPENR
ncbi:MAG: hypothetical protein A1D16_09445 [Flavihumibacter sp. CACIAM 22H1]|nr:MAG: hypothetical protein A1D16_09445 [Flavihumibacter sp. CACIAM 22H1]